MAKTTMTTTTTPWDSAAADGVEAEAKVVDLGPRGEIATGICFLDHMIDQLTAHAQLGVSVRVRLPTTMSDVATASTAEARAWLPAHRDYAGNASDSGLRPHDRGIFAASGAAIGAALRRLVQDSRDASKAKGASAGDGDRATKRARHSGSAEAAAAASAASAGSGETVFYCPLDEAFTEARVTLPPSATAAAGTAVSETNLAPYGSMPAGGRTFIGCYRCDLTPVFWASLAEELGGAVRLRKVRGQNAHHIVEATFKAFARAFRAALDDDDDDDRDDEDDKDHGANGQDQQAAALARNGCVEPFERRAAARALIAAAATEGSEQSGQTGGVRRRFAEKSRSTKETSIEVTVDLDDLSTAAAAAAADGGSSSSSSSSSSSISTGVVLLDGLLGELQAACGFAFSVRCAGDTYIDDHHTAEDVSITLGQCLLVSLGDKAGLARMGCAEATSAALPASLAFASFAEAAEGGARVRVVIDLSNRPHFESNLEQHLDEEYVGGYGARDFALLADPATTAPSGAPSGAASGAASGATSSAVCGRALTCEMLVHVFESLTLEMRATAHVEVLRSGGQSVPGHSLHVAVAMARAYGAALAECVRVDRRRAGKVASSKGTLSI